MMIKYVILYKRSNRRDSIQQILYPVDESHIIRQFLMWNMKIKEDENHLTTTWRN